MTRHDRSGSATETARKCWGDDLPEWVGALAAACDASSQAAVARRLLKDGGSAYSAAAVSTVLSRTYNANLTAIERAVRTALGLETDCPHLGRPISFADCDRHSSGIGSAASPMAMRQWRACQGCPRSKSKGADRC